MDDIIFVDKLLDIQEKYSDFFFENKQTIIDYLDINWADLSVKGILYKNLPPEIVFDIEQVVNHK